MANNKVKAARQKKGNNIAANNGASIQYEKKYFKGQNAAQCAAHIRATHPDVGTGPNKLKVAYLELVPSSPGPPYGTLVFIGPTKPTASVLTQYLSTIVKNAATGKGAFGHMKEAAKANQLRANAVTPKEADIDEAAANLSNTIGGYSDDIEKPRTKGTGKGNTRSASTNRKAGNQNARTETHSNGSNESKSAPPPPMLNDPDYEKFLLEQSRALEEKEALALDRAYEDEMTHVGLNSNVSGYPVTTGGYKLSTGVDSSYGINPRPIGVASQVPAYSGSVVVGGHEFGAGLPPAYSDTKHEYLPPIYPGTAGEHIPTAPHVPYTRRTVAGERYSDDKSFKEAWNQFWKLATQGSGVGSAMRADTLTKPSRWYP